MIQHIGAEGAMSPCRIQDAEEAKHQVNSCWTAAGVIAVIIRNRFPLMTYKDALIDRLKVDERMTAAGSLRQPAEGRGKLLICAAIMHPRSILYRTTCSTKSRTSERASSMASILPQLDNVPDTETTQEHHRFHQAQMDVDGQATAGHTQHHNLNTT